MKWNVHKYYNHISGTKLNRNWKQFIVIITRMYSKMHYNIQIIHTAQHRSLENIYILSLPCNVFVGVCYCIVYGAQHTTPQSTQRTSLRHLVSQSVSQHVCACVLCMYRWLVDCFSWTIQTRIIREWLCAVHFFSFVFLLYEFGVHVSCVVFFLFLFS